MGVAASPPAFEELPRAELPSPSFAVFSLRRLRADDAVGFWPVGEVEGPAAARAGIGAG